MVHTRLFTLHYTRTLDLTQGLQSPPGSAVGPSGPARQLRSAGSTTCCRPSLGRGPPSHRCAHSAPPWRTARAPACRHEAAARSRLTAIESSFPGCARQPPATHGVQPDVRLRCGREAQASGSSSTWVVDQTTWSVTASTARMVPKDCSHWGRQWTAHLPAHQRGRGMDVALQVWGTDPARGRGRTVALS